MAAKQSPSAKPAKSRRERTTKSVRRRVIVVLGMHRSGTSALARVISLLGATLPQNLMSATEANPLGYFESQTIFELHEELLRSSGTSWSDLAPFPPDWLDSPVAEEWIERLASAVSQEFGQSPLFVLKDPRLALLVPIWMQVFDRLAIAPCFVVSVRNPREVSASLNKSEGTSEAKSMLLWLQYMLEAERHTRDGDRVFIRYDDLLSDWRSVANSLETRLNLKFPRRARRAEAEIDSFLTRDLRHHTIPDEETFEHHRIPDWVKQVFSWACDATSGIEGDAAALDAVAAAFHLAERVYGPLLSGVELAEAKMQRRVRVLEEEALGLRERVSDRDATIKKLGEELDERAVPDAAAISAEAASKAAEAGARAIGLLREDVAQLGTQVTSTTEVTLALRSAFESHGQAGRLEAEIVGLRERVERRDLQIEELKRAAHESSRHRGALEAEAGELRRALDSKRSEVAGLTRDLRERGEKVDAMAAEARLERLAGQRLRQDLNDARCEAEDRAREIGRLEDENDALRISVEERATQLERERDENAERLRELETDRVSMQQEIAGGRAQIERLQAAVVAFEDRERDREGSLRQLGQMRGELVDLRVRLASQGHRMASLRAEARALKENLALARADVEQMEIRARQFEAQSESLIEAREQIDAQSEDLRGAREQIEFLTDQLAEQRALALRAAEEVADLNFCVDQLLAEVDARPPRARYRLTRLMKEE